MLIIHLKIELNILRFPSFNYCSSLSKILFYALICQVASDRCHSKLPVCKIAIIYLQRLGCGQVRIYAIMLSLSEFSVAHTNLLSEVGETA